MSFVGKSIKVIYGGIDVSDLKTFNKTDIINQPDNQTASWLNFNVMG